MKILILGDSFCVTKNDNDHHWVNMLKQHFTIENCASPGIGEYKIFKISQIGPGTSVNG